MTDVVFEEVTFSDSFFLGVRLVNCTFINCKGLKPLHFFKSTPFGVTVENCGFTLNEIATVDSETVRSEIENSALTNLRKGELLAVFTEITKTPAPVT
jgi:hypothetical protein